MNWEKHNPKRDQKTYTWLRLNNDINTDSDLFGLRPDQKLAWIEILCQASKKNSGTFSLNISQLSHVTGVERKNINELIEFLLTKPIISIHDNERSHDVVPTTPTNEQDVRHETNVRTYNSPADAVAPEKTDGSKIWEAYDGCFQQRYGVSPVRNAKTNSLCAQLGKRLGRDAVDVVGFYLQHNDGYVVKHQHDLASLIAKAESYHTQWKRGKPVTSQQIRQFEKQTGNMELLNKVQNGEVK